MQSLHRLITFFADCLQTQWRSSLDFYPALNVEPAFPAEDMHSIAFLLDGTLRSLPSYRTLSESRVDHVWAKDPRIVSGQEHFQYDECGLMQENNHDGKTTSYRCIGDFLYHSGIPPMIFIFQTPTMGYGVRALNARRNLVGNMLASLG